MPNSLLGGDSTINRPDYDSESWSLGYQGAVYGIMADPLPDGVTNVKVSGGDLQGLGDGVPTSILAALPNAPSDMKTAAQTALDQAIAVTPNQ